MRAALIAIAVLLSPLMVEAGEYADLYVIPVAGHLNGVAGSTWMSDVAITNFQSTPLTVDVVVIEAGEGAPDNVGPLASSTYGSSIVVPANGTRILRDAMNGHSGQSQSIGSLLVGADRPFAVSSRTYVNAPSGGTQGQSVVPVRDFIDTTLGGEDATAYLSGLTSNARYRTNIGFVAGTTTGMSIEIALHDDNGATLGVKTFNVAPSSFEHLQFHTSAISSASYEEGSAMVRIVSGTGSVVPYATIVDNVSMGSFYVSAQIPSTITSNRSMFRILYERMRSGESNVR